MEGKQITVILRIPVYITHHDKSDDLGTQKIKAYLSSVLNERESVQSSRGAPCKGRLCFNGELMRDTLHRWLSPIPRALGLEESKAYLGADTTLPGYQCVDPDWIDIEVED